MERFIDPKAKVGEGTEIGYFTVVGAGAIIGSGCEIGNSVVIHGGTIIGDRVRIDDNTVVGKLPMKAAMSATTDGIVGRGVTVENHCTIGRRCKLESESYITAYSKLGDRVFVAPGVATSNDNYIGRTEERFKHFKGVIVEKGGRIGVGAVILPGKTVGADAVVAAGSVLTRNAPARKIVLGSPAKPVRDVPDDQLLENQGWDD